MKAQLLVGNAIQRLKDLDAESVKTVVTSPPYWGLRDYDNDEQLGREETPDEFVERLCDVFDEVRRVLKDDGTCWVNLGDSYSAKDIGTIKRKDLVGIPWRFAFAMQRRGWFLRQDIIWSKPNPMPESVKDRCTKSHEYIFLFTKQRDYWFDGAAIAEPMAASSIERLAQNVDDQTGSFRAHAGIRGDKPMKAMGNSKNRNKRSVWTVTTKRYSGAHFAVFPTDLIEPCILAGSEIDDVVLDPFAGSGTTGVSALRNNRNFVGIELNSEYVLIARKRLHDEFGLMIDLETQ